MTGIKRGIVSWLLVAVAGCSGTSGQARDGSAGDGSATGGVVSDIIIPFQLIAVLYAPPGGKSIHQWLSVGRVTADWQAVDSNGIPHPTAVSSSEDVAVADAGLQVSSATGLKLKTNSDQPTGLDDLFMLGLGIPAQQTVFPDSVQLRLDYGQSTGGVSNLSGRALVALAESWPETHDILLTELQSYVQTDQVTSFLAPEDARNLLLLDPNFFVTAEGHMALRYWDDVRQLVEQPGYQYRFVPEHFGTESESGGNPLGNTLEVPSGLPGQLTETAQLTADRFASLVGTASRSPMDSQSQAALQIPTFGSDGSRLASGYTFEQTFERLQIAGKPTLPLASLTPQMASSCLTGLVDIYVDTVFGIYFPVPRSADFIGANSLWSAGECRGNPRGRPYLMACATDGDCGSMVCTNAICAPSACSPNCAQSEACGVGSPYPTDCASHECELGICGASYGMPCWVDSECVTQNCSHGLCGLPKCSPHCGPGSGCAVGGDCDSGNCSAGTCT